MLMQGANDLESYWKRRLRYIWKWRICRHWRLLLPGIVTALVAIVLVLASIAWGIDHEMSINCRSKSDPKVYGVEFCVPPATRRPAPTTGGARFSPRGGA